MKVEDVNYEGAQTILGLFCFDTVFNSFLYIFILSQFQDCTFGKPIKVVLCKEN